MTDPGTWPTNHYSIGNSKSIQWTAYNLSTEGVTLHQKHEDLRTSASSPVTHALLECRSQGLSVFLDVQTWTLWYFQCEFLYGRSIDADKAIESQLAGHALSIHQSTQGTLSIERLIDTSDEYSVYERLVRSILASALHHLAKIPNYCSLGLNVDHSSDTANVNALYGFTSHELGELLSIWRLQVRWSSAGDIVLIVSSFSKNQHVLLSEVLQNIDLRVLNTFKTSILLVPSGQRVQFVHTYGGGRAQPHEEDLVQVRRLGFTISSSDAWVILQTGENASRRLFPWPAKLCVLCLNGVHRDIGVYSSSIISDPISEAEEWYGQRFERARAAEARVIKEDAERRQQEDQRETQQIYNNFDARIDIRSPGANFTALNEVNSIYPTPPEGQLLQGTPQDDHGFGVQDQSQPAAGEVHARTYAAQSANNEEGNFRMDSDGTASLGFVPEDLFGDINDETLAIGGVTEDDFNFFDDPDNNLRIGMDQDGGDDRRSKLESPSGSTAPHSRAMSHNETSPAQDIDMTNPPAPSPRDLLSSKLDRRGAHGIFQGSQLFLSNLELENVSFDTLGSLGDALALEGKTYNETDATTGNVTSSAIDDSLHEAISDEKYNAEGKYGFKDFQSPLGTRPRPDSDQKRSLLPHLRDLRPATEASDAQLSDSSSSFLDSANDEDLMSLDSAPESAPTSPKEGQHLTGSKDDLLYKDGLDHILPDNKNLPLSPNAENHEVVQALSSLPDIGLLDSKLSCSSIIRADNAGELKYLLPELKPDMFIQVAQMLIEQAIFDRDTSIMYEDLRGRRSAGHASIHERQSPVSDQQLTAFSGIFQTQRLQLDDLITSASEVGKEAKQSNDAQAVPKRQDGSKAETHISNPCFPIKPPSIRLRRGENTLEMTSVSLSFWEELGLGPLRGEKHIDCLYMAGLQEVSKESNSPSPNFKIRAAPSGQNFDTVLHKIESFISQVCESYQSLKLGICTLSPVQGKWRLVCDEEGSLSNCEALGKAAAQVDGHDKILMIFMVDTSSDHRLSPMLCKAFADLVTSYRSTIKSGAATSYSDMILQIVPFSEIQPVEKMPFASIDECNRLAFCIYEKLPGLQNGARLSSPQLCAPSIKIAKRLPRSIQLRISPVAKSPLEPAECLHLAYMWTESSPWLTASWTDNHGNIQWHAAYHIGTSQDKQISRVAAEMIATSVGLRSEQFKPRWLFVAKCGQISSQEADIWHSSLRSNRDHDFQHCVIILDPKPNISLCLPEVKRAPATSASNGNVGSANQSMATPSPEPTTQGGTPGGWASTSAAATPSEANERQNSLLEDIRDECWGVAVASPMKYPKPSNGAATILSESYLIKRTTAESGGRAAIVAINFIHCPGSPLTWTKELLGMYRGLVVLGGHRGVINPNTQILPIHAAAAIKAHSRITKVMG